MSYCQRDIRPLLGATATRDPGSRDIARLRTTWPGPSPDTRPASLPLASGADTDVAPPVAGLAALGAAGVALAAAAAWIAATGAGTPPRGFSAAVHALVIAAPMAAGLYAVYRHPQGRFGWLLILAAVLWSPTMLAESGDSVLYSIGRVWVWFAELLLIYLVLAFPLRAAGEPNGSAPRPRGRRGRVPLSGVSASQ